MRPRNARRLTAHFEKKWEHTSKRWFVIKLLLVIIVLAVIGALKLWPQRLLGGNNDAAANASSPHTVIVIGANAVAKTEVVRSRLCHSSLACKNGRDGVDVVQLKSGAMPTRLMAAVVRTDEDCAPDADGNSHCINEIRLSDGRLIVVQHTHNMNIYPCLKPGQRVEVEPETAA